MHILSMAGVKHLPAPNTPLNPLLVEGTFNLPSKKRGRGGCFNLENILPYVIWYKIFIIYFQKTKLLQMA